MSINLPEPDEPQPKRQKEQQPVKPKVTAEQVRELIRLRYPDASHVTLDEVRDAAGYSAQRTCDVLSIGTWPSRGLVLRGFEVKVTRGDWLREVKEPAKAEAFTPFCDEWYIVAGDAKIVQADELPATWGLLVAVQGKRLECVKPAVPNPRVLQVDRGLLVAMLKRAIVQGPTAKALADAEEKGRLAGAANTSVQVDREGDRTALLAKVKLLEAGIAAFEKASGVLLGDFRYADPVKFGNAVRDVLNGGTRQIAVQATRMLEQHAHVGAALKRLIALHGEKR